MKSFKFALILLGVVAVTASVFVQSAQAQRYRCYGATSTLVAPSQFGTFSTFGTGLPVVGAVYEPYVVTNSLFSNSVAGSFGTFSANSSLERAFANQLASKIIAQAEFNEVSDGAFDGGGGADKKDESDCEKEKMKSDIETLQADVKGIDEKLDKLIAALVKKGTIKEADLK
ncbi:hypothetical protein [Rubinisphaera italica]|uniref:Uncharacterized protein n=1 Tax=Rubinisphaera italica TaxID=2527969 RepID=A0A5C5XM63_9PLAN|nr:hypothetical protein [Rubinisphaera italica]TWT64050.1 hypothetical protein Pan54_48110 [Rubinisphaera italica]